MPREFSVVVSINAAGARRGAGQFKAGADTVTRSSRRMDRQLVSSKRKVTALITTIGRFRGVATLAFAGFLGVGGLGSVIRTLSQFETAMSSVRALVSAQGPQSIDHRLASKTRTENPSSRKARNSGTT